MTFLRIREQGIKEETALHRAREQEGEGKQGW